MPVVLAQTCPSGTQCVCVVRNIPINQTGEEHLVSRLANALRQRLRDRVEGVHGRRSAPSWGSDVSATKPECLESFKQLLRKRRKTTFIRTGKEDIVPFHLQMFEGHDSCYSWARIFLQEPRCRLRNAALELLNAVSGQRQLQLVSMTLQMPKESEMLTSLHQWLSQVVMEF